MNFDPVGHSLNIAGGLQNMQLQRRAADERTQAIQDQRAQQDQMAAAREQGAQLLTGGTPDQIAQFGIRNPEVMQDFIRSAQFQDQSAVRGRLKYAQDVISGAASPRSLLENRIAEVEARGGQADRLRTLLDQDDQAIVQAAMKDWSVIDPQGYMAYRGTQGQEGKGFTLSEGQGRYDAQGQLIAYMPKTMNSLDKELKQEESRFNKASKLRGEVEKVSKVYRDVEDSFGRIQAAVSGEPSGASDMALIFNYMKMLDPGSTVREGEFATAANTGGLSAKIINAYNRTRDGQMLTPEMRKNFVSQAESQFSRASKSHNKRLNDYEKLGKRYGLERGDIVVSETEEQPPAPQQQPPATQAPAAAIQALQANPQLKEQFRAKYGYLPEGM